MNIGGEIQSDKKDLLYRTVTFLFINYIDEGEADTYNGKVKDFLKKHCCDITHITHIIL